MRLAPISIGLIITLIYVPFNLILKDCVINATVSQPNIVNLRIWNDNVNSWVELMTKCWPNITIDNLTVNISERMKVFELFSIPRDYTNKRPVGSISEITINGLNFQYPLMPTSVEFKLSSSEVQLVNNLKCTVNNLHTLLEDNAPVVKSMGKGKKKDVVIINMKGPTGEAVQIFTP